MANVEVKIIYTGLIVDDIRKGDEIARYFMPNNSYVDKPVFTDGYTNDGTVGDGNSYGKSIYATNVDGMGEFDPHQPIVSFTGKIAQFERAIRIAKAAEAAGTENTGLTFEIDGYEDEIYWNQIAGALAYQGFYIKVGDNEYGTNPGSEGD